MVQEHLKQHDNDAEQSLAAVSSVGSVRQELQQIADPDVQVSLAHVSAARHDDASSWATRAPSVGTSTSSGLRFRILRPHAEGGLGKVSVARDEELHREVALKEIQDRHADNPDSRSRFVQEAEITGGLEHPGIVPVYGLGQYADGRPFYAMRFIRGDSLKEAIERFHKAEGPQRDPGERSLELRKLLGRFLDVCNAIGYAHSRGVLHRDLKPGNIMLGQYGETLVVDWGLAKPVEQPEDSTGPPEGFLKPASASASAPTQMGSAIGTPQYMSPEQAAGRLDLLGPASDVYSLGATLYCLLTGRPPVSDSDQGEVLRKVQRGDFPHARQIKATVPAALEAICLKALALKPQDRYATPRMLADDVEHWLADEPVTAYRESWTARAGRWSRQHRTGVTAAVVALLVAMVGLVAATVLLTAANERERAAKALAERNEKDAVNAKNRADQNALIVVDQAATALRTAEAELEPVKKLPEQRRAKIEQLQSGLGAKQESSELAEKQVLTLRRGLTSGAKVRATDVFDSMRRQVTLAIELEEDKAALATLQAANEDTELRLAETKARLARIRWAQACLSANRPVPQELEATPEALRLTEAETALEATVLQLQERRVRMKQLQLERVNREGVVTIINRGIDAATSVEEIIDLFLKGGLNRDFTQDDYDIVRIWSLDLRSRLAKAKQKVDEINTAYSVTGLREAEADVKVAQQRLAKVREELHQPQSTLLGSDLEYEDLPPPIEYEDLPPPIEYEELSPLPPPKKPKTG